MSAGRRSKSLVHASYHALIDVVSDQLKSRQARRKPINYVETIIRGCIVDQQNFIWLFCLCLNCCQTLRQEFSVIVIWHYNTNGTVVDPTIGPILGWTCHS